MILLNLLTLAAAVLAAPSPDSTWYVVVNHGRHVGEMRVVTDADSVLVRFTYVDRSRVPRVETRYRLGEANAPLRIESRGVGADLVPKDVSERFLVTGDSAAWSSSVDSGQARVTAASFYRPRSPTPYDNALLARFLLQQPLHAATLLPAGTARLEIAADTIVTADGVREHVRLVALDGLATSPILVWLDDLGALYASDAGWFTTIRCGAEGTMPVLRAVERAYRARRSEALARRLSVPVTGPTVIRNGDVFDSERGVIRPRTSIVIDRGRIVAVGPSETLRLPERATVIDATGKTVLPGLWDMHTHLDFTLEEDGALQLAAGITTVRDLASDMDAALSYRERTNAGTLLGPRVLLAGFIEGPGKWAGPTDVLVRTEDEARTWVARYDSLGYRQIKLYNLVHPDLVPTIAEEAHRRRMRLSGHVPRGLSVPSAVLLGYDEIQHAAFLFSTFFQDSLYTPRMRAYSQVAAAVAPTFNVDAPEVTALIMFLREHGTVIDGTFNIWQDASRPLPDGTDAVFGPTLAWLPPVIQRELTQEPPASPQDAARADAASANYRRMLKRLFDAGVTLVPGTDNFAGLSYHGELEVYERAGIPATSVLQLATIVSARVMKEDSAYGSITPGKIADLVIVNGRPAERIRDLRRTEWVVRAGRVFSAAQLYSAVGVRPRW
jgi:hypothetical protein